MFNALISHKGQTAILTLPMDRFSLQYELAQIGIRQQLTNIPISDEEEQDVQVKLYADSDMGNSLAMLFKSSHSLEDANLCAHMVENARLELLEELEQHIVYGQYHSPKAVMEDIKAMTDELGHTKLMELLDKNLDLELRRTRTNGKGWTLTAFAKTR